METDETGNVSRAISFVFPLVARGYRTTIEMRKERAFSPWKAIRKTTTPIRPDS